MKEMYPAIPNSPVTSLKTAITNAATTIQVNNISAIPAAPNIVVIGADSDAETILYTGISGDTLTGVTRGFEGTAKAWAISTIVSRNLTAYDYNSIKENIEKLNEQANNAKVLPFNSSNSNAPVISYPINLDPDDPAKGLFRPGAKGVESVKQEVVNGDSGSTFATNGTGSRLKIDVDGNISANNNYSSSLQTVSVVSGKEYFLYIKVSENRLHGAVGLQYSDNSNTTVNLNATNVNNEVYSIVTASMTGLANPFTLDNSIGNNVSANLLSFMVIPAEGYTQEQLLTIARNGYWEGTKTSAENYDCVSIGKNKFDYDKAKDIDNTFVNAYRLFKIDNLFPNTYYIFSNYADISGITGVAIYLWDKDNYAESTKSYILQTSGVFKSSASLISNEEGAIYLAIHNESVENWEQFIEHFKDAQLEIGTAITDREPYTSDKTEFSTDKPMIQLPNGISDEIKDNKLYKRNKHHVLQASDFDDLQTGYTNVDVVRTTIFSDNVSFTNSLDTHLLIKNKQQMSFNLVDSIANIGKYYSRDNQQLYFVVAKGAYTDLPTAQADLEGIEVYYQLAQEEIIEDGQQGYKAPSSIQAYQNGDLVVIPKIDFYKTLNNETTITLGKAMLELEGVFAQLDDDAELELLPVTLSTDGKTITLTNAYTGLVHVKGVMHPRECLIPITTGNLPINIAAQAWDNAAGVSKLNGDVSALKENAEFVSRQIEGMKVTTTKDLTISTGSWTEDNGNARWYYQVTDTSVTANTIVNVNIHVGDLDKTDMLLPVTESFDGYYRLYASSQPSQDFVVDVIKQN